MITFPNAKINLGLNIVSKREDGFHNIETIFYPIMIKDALEFVENSLNSTNIRISGIHVDGDEKSNLVYRAYRVIASKYSLPSLSIYLQKNIPLGAGLGGGSSDAAFMLKSLNEHYSLKMEEVELEAYAVELGSDCPFFIKNKPVFASGRGEVMENLDLSLKEKFIVLVKPNIHVSTKEAYEGCIPHVPKVSLKEIIKKPISEWRDLMLNDFENSIFEKYPKIQEVKMSLYNMGAVYASMSGSGASVFGIFDDEVDLRKEFDDCYYWSGYLG